MPLNTIETYLQQLLPGLGVNKMREITRLVYEITKRDGITPAQLFPAEKKWNFESAKTFLLKNAIRSILPPPRATVFICLNWNWTPPSGPI